MLLVVPSLVLLTLYAKHHAWLCDDAFISFRYVRNLVNGHGLVFNVGERVEGYTNFLWVLELAAVWKLFGVVPEHSSYVLSVLYTVGMLWVTARLAWKTPFTTQRVLALAGVMFLLAINRNVAVWTTSGLETRQFTFFVLLAILWLQRSDEDDDWRTLVPASLAWSLAELTRPEAVLLFACGGAWLVGRQLFLGQLRLRAIAGYVVPFALVVGTHFVWRYAYYGDWFPNTYYAKDVRAWPEAGFHYLTLASIEGGLMFVLPLCALGLAARLTLARDGLHALSAICIVMHAAYMVRIGGDHFEFRPLDFYWPLLAVATVDGLLLLQSWLARWFMGRKTPHALAVSWYATALSALVVVVYSTALQIAHFTITLDLKTRAETYKLAAEIKPSNFAAVFLLPGMRGLIDLYNETTRFDAGHSVGVRHVEHRVFWRQQVKHYAPYIGHTDGLFPPDAVMKLGTIGVASYALSGLPIIDTLGLTDRTVARNPVTADNRERQLAHDRSPPPGYLERRGVNLHVRPAMKRFAPGADYALQLDDKLWMPLDSERPDWLRTAFASRGLWHKRLRPSLKRNDVWIAGTPMSPVRELGFFDDGTVNGWTLEGAAMHDQPRGATTSGQQRVKGYVGAGMLNSFHAVSGDGAKGSALSPEFTPVTGEHLVFVVGGGDRPDVGVELRVDGKLVKTWRGDDSEEMALAAYDLTAVAGRRCQVRVLDHSNGAWGHVVADHFMIMRPQSAVLSERSAL